MSQAAQAAGAWHLQIHDELPSTSDACIEAAKAGAPDGLALLARFQTAGRGSHGRIWASLPGNLNLSILIRGPIPAACAGHWSLLAGLATLRALAPYAPPGSLQLKWPNDVNLHGAKLAGILIDSAASADAMLDWLVIGIGANLAQAPHFADRPTACLVGADPSKEGQGALPPGPPLGREPQTPIHWSSARQPSGWTPMDRGLGLSPQRGPGAEPLAFLDRSAPPAPEVVARALLTHIWRLRSTLEQDGLGAIRAAWLAHAHPIGTLLRSGDRRGRFAGLSESGALLLDDGALHAIGAGEITIDAGATAASPHSGSGPIQTSMQT